MIHVIEKKFYNKIVINGYKNTYMISFNIELCKKY